MINGVIIKQLKVWTDVPDREEEKTTRGYLLEVLRNDEGLIKKFGQTTYTMAYRGTIKAFHYHAKQDDLWFIASGRAKIVLYDKRTDSETRGQMMVLSAGRDDYKLIVIPAGVVHGYQVLSEEPVGLFYHTTEPYDPKNPDELRIAWDDPIINAPWEIAK